jgi:hypothetical protein
VQNNSRDAAYNAAGIPAAPPFAQHKSLSHAEIAGFPDRFINKTNWLGR